MQYGPYKNLRVTRYEVDWELAFTLWNILTKTLAKIILKILGY